MSKLTKAVKRHYELLAVRWASIQQAGGNPQETEELKKELLQIEQGLEMTAEEILDSSPKE